VLRVLKDEFGLGADDARANDNYALRTAARKGHTGVLLVLKREFELTADDARALDYDALRMAAQYGHTGVLLVLRREWHVTVEDGFCRLEDIPYGASSSALVDELVLHWGATPLTVTQSLLQRADAAFVARAPGSTSIDFVEADSRLVEAKSLLHRWSFGDDENHNGDEAGPANMFTRMLLAYEFRGLAVTDGAVRASAAFRRRAAGVRNAVWLKLRDRAGNGEPGIAQLVLEFVHGS
jgi:hypothetical protein